MWKKQAEFRKMELDLLYGVENVIDNMAKLINFCGKAELLDIEYDMKSKLREIISDVLILKR